MNIFIESIHAVDFDLISNDQISCSWRFQRGGWESPSPSSPASVLAGRPPSLPPPAPPQPMEPGAVLLRALPGRHLVPSLTSLPLTPRTWPLRLPRCGRKHRRAPPRCRSGRRRSASPCRLLRRRGPKGFSVIGFFFFFFEFWFWFLVSWLD